MAYKWDTGTYLIKFLAVFFLFEFLPVPVNLYIFLMRGDNFILDLVASLLLVLFLKGTSSGFPLISFCLDLVDCGVS